MNKTRFAIRSTISLTVLLTKALSLVLLGTAAAEDEGQFLILNAQYGNEHNHVDVTQRLKYLARQDRPFHVNHDSMDADPDPGHSKALRVFARGPNGNE